ncbi:hypothetical protein [Streptomyces rimosus]|uniref:hypothetical protein n=1 Tax=Streptomyces rimosus TaxID=1927 RepID=UPI0004CA57AB|nr:hypothetical protein [Streptomyces rimosus]
MTPSRGERAAPPAPDGQWEVRFADAASAKGWECLAQQARENTYRAWLTIRTEPRPTAQTPRHHQLKGTLARATYRGRTCEQWQIEVTGSGRIWFLIDASRSTCWITYASTRHPAATDR